MSPWRIMQRPIAMVAGQLPKLWNAFCTLGKLTVLICFCITTAIFLGNWKTHLLLDVMFFYMLYL